MRNKIPALVIDVVANEVSSSETHDSLESLFRAAGAPGDPPQTNKRVKALEWLRRANRVESVEPLRVLGEVLEAYMEADPDPFTAEGEWCLDRQERLRQALSSSGLEYVRGGFVVPVSAGLSSRSLEPLIRGKRITALEEEFDRALRSVETSPREAVSAACNILESTCKVYIEEERLEPPRKQDLGAVWSVVRKNLGLNPKTQEDRDIQEILGAIGGLVSGIGALRTHGSSAHGSGYRRYRLEPRHARLAVNAAHTLTMFIWETWQKRSQ